MSQTSGPLVRTHLASLLSGRTRMLADLLIGLTLWTATSVLAAVSLGRIFQHGKVHERRPRQGDKRPLADVA